MNDRRFQDIWRDQCAAARAVEERQGTASALEYLLGEKLLRYAETAVVRREFARKLPCFVAEIRAMFESHDIRSYLNLLERVEFDAGPSGCRARAERRKRFCLLKDLLLAERLGTS